MGRIHFAFRASKTMEIVFLKNYPKVNFEGLFYLI